MTLKETPSIVTAAGVAGLDFTDEVATANALVPVLEAQGVKAIVVLIHQGGSPRARRSPAPRQSTRGLRTTPPAPGRHAERDDSAIIPIAENLDPQIDMIDLRAHPPPYVCNIPDPDGTRGW